MDEDAFREAESTLQKTIAETDELLAVLDERIAQLEGYQLLYDMLGVGLAASGLGLTTVGLVLALIALSFLKTSKEQAALEARAATVNYLSGSEVVRSAVREWLNENPEEMARHMRIVLATRVKTGADTEGSYEDAFDDDDLDDLPSQDDEETRT